MSSFNYEEVYKKFQNFVQLNINPNNTHKATININVKEFNKKKFKGTEKEMIDLVTQFGIILKENNAKYKNLGTVVINLKNVSHDNFSLSYFKKIYKVLDEKFYKEDIVDKIICFCSNGIPIVVWKLIKPILDPMTAKKFIFYKV